MGTTRFTWACALLLVTAGCHSILGLEEARVTDMDAGPPQGCTSDEDCGADRECRAGKCRDANNITPEAGVDSGLDSGMDAGPDAGDGGEPECMALDCGSGKECRVIAGEPTCACAPGFDPDGEACVDINECAEPDRGGCSENATCDNAPGTHACTCNEGYVDMQGDGSVCVHRCELAECDPDFGTCSLMDAVAVCACTGSHVLVGKDCVYTPSCENLGCGTATNTQCALQDGSTTEYECRCLSGYEPSGDGSCKDIDECAPPSSVCADVPHSECKNAPGEYSCPCIPGYRKNSQGVCENISDCVDNPCGVSGTCVDGVNDFTCDCKPGFTRVDPKTCTDQTHDCPSNACAGGICVDGVGTYSCSCNSGYVASADGKSCVDAGSNCPSGACEPGGDCIDGVNDYSCRCNTGYSLAEGGRECVDIDNCAPNPCKNSGVCSDRPNDYVCDCTGTGFIGKNCDTRSAGCAGAGEPCSVGRGECLRQGTYVCNAQGTALSCSATAGPSSTEICDGKDNDCDGDIDETFPTLGETCTAGTGECARTGTNVCNASGSAVVCNATAGTPAPNDTSCNGLDDDCSGQVDEDYPNQSISCGTGPCQRSGTRSCSGGKVVESCTPGTAAANDASCNGVDDDCNGQVDEDYVSICLDLGRAQVCSGGTPSTSPCSANSTCVAGTCVGTCRGGDKRCSSSGNYEVCGTTTGQWSINQDCGPTEQCDLLREQCTDVSPFTLGRSSLAGSGATNRPLLDNRLYATPVFVPEDVRLTNIGAVLPADSLGGRFWLGIYLNDASTGRPGQLLANSDTEVFSPPKTTHSTAQSYEGTPLSQTIVLSGNATYWIAVRADESTGDALRLFNYPSSSTNYDAADTASFLPLTFSSNPTSFSGDLSLYVRVQRLVD
jgi:Notch-like protein